MQQFTNQSINGHALVQGASRGIGLALVRSLLSMPAISHVTASCRRLESAQGLRGLEVQWPGRLRLTTLDVTNEKSIENASSAIPGGTPPLRVLFNCAGVLHSSDLQPEKRLSDVRITALRQYFDVNAIGPLLVLKHFKRHLAATGRVVIGNVSARVGSICLLYTSPSPRDGLLCRMPSSA